MAVSHEQIWIALLDRLKANAPSFVVHSRQFRDWALEQLPALELMEGDTETPIAQEGGLLLGWKLSGDIQIVAREVPGSELARSPMSGLNDLLAEVRTALEWDPTLDSGSRPARFTTLGHRIELFTIGPVTKGGGNLTGQVVAKFPIEMDVYLTD